METAAGFSSPPLPDLLDQLHPRFPRECLGEGFHLLGLGRQQMGLPDLPHLQEILQPAPEVIPAQQNLLLLRLKDAQDL
jgi:hypothetical protein